MRRAKHLAKACIENSCCRVVETQKLLAGEGDMMKPGGEAVMPTLHPERNNPMRHIRGGAERRTAVQRAI